MVMFTCKKKTSDKNKRKPSKILMKGVAAGPVKKALR
jgi:hypothetical protein